MAPVGLATEVVYSGTRAYSAAYPDCPLSSRDIDADGALTNFDIDPFVTLLLTQP